MKNEHQKHKQSKNPKTDKHKHKKKHKLHSQKHSKKHHRKSHHKKPKKKEHKKEFHLHQTININSKTTPSKPSLTDQFSRDFHVDDTSSALFNRNILLQNQQNVRKQKGINHVLHDGKIIDLDDLSSIHTEDKTFQPSEVESIVNDPIELNITSQGKSLSSDDAFGRKEGETIELHDYSEPKGLKPHYNVGDKPEKVAVHPTKSRSNFRGRKNKKKKSPVAGFPYGTVLGGVGATGVTGYGYNLGRQGLEQKFPRGAKALYGAGRKIKEGFGRVGERLRSATGIRDVDLSHNLGDKPVNKYFEEEFKRQTGNHGKVNRVTGAVEDAEFKADPRDIITNMTNTPETARTKNLFRDLPDGTPENPFSVSSVYSTPPDTAQRLKTVLEDDETPLLHNRRPFKIKLKTVKGKQKLGREIKMGELGETGELGGSAESLAGSSSGAGELLSTAETLAPFLGV